MKSPSPEVKLMRFYRNMILFLGLLGIGISYYSIVVNYNKLRDPTYRALCDISESIRCSNVLTSSYSKGFGILGSFLQESSPLLQSNGVYGLFMYTAFMITCIYPSRFLAKVQLIFAIVSCVVTIYLGYILFAVLEEACVVCMSSYLVNFLLLIFSFKYKSAVNAYLGSQFGYFEYTSLDGKTFKKKV